MAPEEVIGRVLGVDPRSVTDTTTAGQHENWDSLAHITLMLELQSVYNVMFSIEETLLIKDCAAIKRVLADKGVRW